MADIALLDDRTRIKSDPVRNFKFQVQIVHQDANLSREVAQMGFTQVSGLGQQTEMVPYREGGWNTNPHKLPGMTDFPPLSMASGVYYQKPGMWNMARQMFSTAWGEGTLGVAEEFRFDLIIRVLDHPVTEGPASGARGSTAGAVLGFVAYNAWVGGCNFGDLNAMDNSVLVHSLTLHHEGLEPLFGHDEVVSLKHKRTSVGAIAA